MNILRIILITIILNLSVVIGLVAAEVSTAKEYYNKAVVSLNAGEYRKAIELFDKAIDIDSEFAAAYVDRGNAKLTLKEYDDALDDFEEANDLNSDDVQIILKMAQVSMLLEDYDDAVDYFKDALEIESESIDVYKHYLEMIAFYESDAEFNLVVRSAVKAGGRSASLLFAVGKAYYNRNDYVRAANYFKRASVFTGKPYGKLLSQGMIQLCNQDYKEAVNSFTDAIEIKPNSSLAFSGRAYAHLKLRVFFKSIEDCNTAIGFDPQNYFAYYTQGLANSELKDSEKKESNMKKAVEINPLMRSALRHLGNLYISQKDSDKLNYIVKKFVNIEGDSFDVCFYSGVCNLMKNYRNAAIENFHCAISFQPENGELYYLLGLSYIVDASSTSYSHNTCVSFFKAIDFGYDEAQTLVKEKCSTTQVGRVRNALQKYKKEK